MTHLSTTQSIQQPFPMALPQLRYKHAWSVTQGSRQPNQCIPLFPGYYVNTVDFLVRLGSTALEHQINILLNHTSLP